MPFWPTNAIHLPFGDHAGALPKRTSLRRPLPSGETMQMPPLQP